MKDFYLNLFIFVSIFFNVSENFKLCVLYYISIEPCCSREFNMCVRINYEKSESVVSVVSDSS